MKNDILLLITLVIFFALADIILFFYLAPNETKSLLSILVNPFIPNWWHN